jgi:hypothetical protein
MNLFDDISPFLNSPDRLVELVRRVVDHLTPKHETGSLRECELQLREISHTINRLESANVSVPEPLRSEKMRLLSEVGVTYERSEELIRVCNGIEHILIDLRNRLGNSKRNRTNSSSRTFSNSDCRLSRAILGDAIITSLNRLGGKATRSAVFTEMARVLKEQFTTGDLEATKWGGRPAWQDKARKARQDLIKKGVLRQDSPPGIWELNGSPK